MAKPNPENSGWIIAGTIFVGGVLAFAWSRTSQAAPVPTPAKPAGFQPVPQPPPATPQPAPQDCGSLKREQGAPYGWVSDGQGGCQPAPVPPEDANCNTRQVWSFTEKKCVTPPWNRIPAPPSEPVEVPLPQQFEYQLTPQDGLILDQLGYEATSQGVFAFKQDFNNLNGLFIEQGDAPMGGILLNEDMQINNETRQSMGWALAYAQDQNQDWQEIMDGVNALLVL